MRGKEEENGVEEKGEQVEVQENGREDVRDVGGKGGIKVNWWKTEEVGAAAGGWNKWSKKRKMMGGS